MLVAPVVEAGATSRGVFFPYGKWTHLQNPNLSYEDPIWAEVNFMYDPEIEYAPVPEPSTFAFLGGLYILGYVLYRKRCR